ncbi:substrate-binding domain-containing protein [Paenibacillus donghaensis]|nr:substrate-binding domain-containing protein [Paenibacillus donghaensis]
MNTRSRPQAYEQIMAQYLLPIAEKWYYSSVYSLRYGEQVVQRLVAAKNRPQAVLCANDWVAAGVLSEARRQSLSVPGELAIVGFDNSELSRTLGITTIYNPISSQARNSFRLMTPKLIGRNLELQPMTFRLVERETT